MNTDIDNFDCHCSNKQEVVKLALDIGEHMLMCGGEVDRVEDTIGRICRAYGAERVDVFSITSLIIATATWSEKEIVSQTRRVPSVSRNFDKLAALNDLSRRMCREKMPLDEANEKVQYIIKNMKSGAIRVFIGSLLSAGGFAIFFGGTWRDALAATLAAIIIYIVEKCIYSNRINKVVYYMLASFIAGITSIVTVYFGIGENLDMIVIGCIMLVIPGINFTSAVEDVLVGDTATGALKFCESIMFACAIAGGFGLSIYLCGGWNLI